MFINKYHVSKIYLLRKESDMNIFTKTSRLGPYARTSVRYFATVAESTPKNFELAKRIESVSEDLKCTKMATEQLAKRQEALEKELDGLLIEKKELESLEFETDSYYRNRHR